MTALVVLLRRFLVAAPLSLAGGLLLALATLLAGLGLLGTSGWLITGSALAGLGLIVFDTFQPSAGIRFFALARTLARYGERLASHEATFRILADMRVQVFRGIAAAPGRASPRPGSWRASRRTSTLSTACTFASPRRSQRPC